MDAQESSTVVHEFRVPRGVIRASITYFRRRSRCDLRLWIRSEDTGELIPTTKGLSVHVEQFAELRAAVDALAQVLGPAGEPPHAA